MKRILALFLCFSTFLVHGQESSVAQIHYTFKHVNDTSRRDAPQRDDVVSYLGKEGYYYTSFSPFLMKEQIQGKMAAPDFDGHMSIEITTTEILHSYIVHPRRQQMQEIEGITSSFDAFVHDAPYPTQDWQIEEEVRKIGGYTCQKATTTFKGRHYTAWFTTDLPFSYGPWKLHGLPGLILSAYDDRREVIFEYAGFDKVSDKGAPLIAPPTYVLRATEAEIEKLKKACKENPGAYFEALQSSGRLSAQDFYGIDYSKNSFDIKKKDYAPSSATNNPIELTP